MNLIVSRILNEQTKIEVWQNENFIVTTPSIPHVTKGDGGHLIVSPRIAVGSINELEDKLLLEMFRIVGKCEIALKTTLCKQGIDVPFTNNQDNGNWAGLKNKPKFLHIHIFGRAKNSMKQTFGIALYCPDPTTDFYDDNERLNDEDIAEIKMVLELDTPIYLN